MTWIRACSRCWPTSSSHWAPPQRQRPRGWSVNSNTLDLYLHHRRGWRGPKIAPLVLLPMRIASERRQHERVGGGSTVQTSDDGNSPKSAFPASNCCTEWMGYENRENPTWVRERVTSSMGYRLGQIFQWIVFDGTYFWFWFRYGSFVGGSLNTIVSWISLTFSPLKRTVSHNQDHYGVSLPK
jgi:hypothetical protein